MGRMRTSRIQRVTLRQQTLATQQAAAPSSAHRLVSMLLAVMLAFSGAVGCLAMSGCKYTDVLTEHVEDPENGTLDDRIDPLYKDVADAEEDPTRTSSKSSKSDRVDHQKSTKPQSDQDQDNNDDTDERDKDKNSDDTQNATSGTQPTQDPGTTENNDDDGKDDDPSESKETEGDGDNDEAEGDTSIPGDDGNGGNSPTGGKGGKGKVYDDGTYDKLPSNVKTVAACGQYATIVQMLCGKGGLVAADRKWLAKVKKKEIFADEETEGISTVSIGWKGDGSKKDSIKVKTVIKAEPDVVLFESGGNALSEKEQKKLTKAGIDVLVMPALGNADTPDEDITKAVKVVGELMKKANTAYDAADMAKRYVKMHDEVIDACRSANGGYTSKMVGGSAYSFIYQGTDLKGTATTDLSNNRYITSFIDSWTTSVKKRSKAVRRYSGAELYLDGETVNASEGVGLSASGTTANFMLMDYYLQVSGVMNNAYDSSKPAISSSTGGSKPYMVIAGTGESLVANTKSFAQRTAPSALWLNTNNYSDSDTWVTVGDDSYPAVMCRKKSQAEKIARSAGRVNGLYNVGQSYEVWVMPSGLAGSWADGTVESFLLAPWAYGMFQLDQDLGNFDGYAESFYQLFYRCSTSNAINNYHKVYKATCPTGTQQE